MLVVNVKQNESIIAYPQEEAGMPLE